MKKYIPLICFMLSGCQLYGGLAIHDPSFDSEFEQERLVATIGASQALSDNAEIYIEHSSQPTHRETNGYGVNMLGLKLTTRKLY